MATAYISLGSNLGDRLAHCRKAALLITGDRRIGKARFSSLYETQPVGLKKQPRFLNAAARLETDLSPLQFLALLQSVEKKLKRRRGVKNGPRTLDLDLLLYGRANGKSRWLTLPHPRMARRRFVLVPLKEVTRKIWYKYRELPVRELLEKAPHRGQEVVLYRRKWR